MNTAGAMHKIVLVLVCLTHQSSGWRLQSPAADGKIALRQAGYNYNSGPLTNARSFHHPLTSLSKLLLACSPCGTKYCAAIAPSRSVNHANQPRAFRQRFHTPICETSGEPAVTTPSALKDTSPEEQGDEEEEEQDLARVAADALSLPPDSFRTLLDQLAASAELAIADGNKLLEVEFPPLGVSKMDDPNLSAYDLLSANLDFALGLVKRLPLGPNKELRKVAITLPDSAERQRAAENYGDDEVWPGTRLWSLNGGDEKPEEFSPMALFGSLFKQGTGEVVAAEWAELYIIVGASAQELPAIQRLAEISPNVPIILFNLKLDTLRGDLGLPAFPPKAVHHEFLCKVKPVYYLRPRSYSLSLSVPPFLVSYQGVLFRRYPEQYQSLLDNGKGTYRCVTASFDRPNLGTFKSQLTNSLKLADEKARESAISQAGRKQSTWWEDDVDGRDISGEWRK